MPRSFGIWSTTITSPIPALKPISTGSEMKLAMNPNRRNDASTSMPPTNSPRVAKALMRDAGSPPGATWPRSTPVRMAIVVVVLTLSGREVPSAA